MRRHELSYLSTQGAVPTLSGMFTDAAALHRDRLCVVTGTANCTFLQINKSVNALANGLLNLGLRPGDKVALLLTNSAEFIVCFFAVLKINAVLVPVNVKYKGEEVRYVLEQSDAGALIVGTEFAHVFQPIQRDLKGLKHVIVVQRQDASEQSQGQLDVSESSTRYSDLIEKHDDREPDIRVHPGDEAVIFYTSGTTGRPKGAVCTHRNCMVAIDSWVKALGITADSRSLMVTPFFHNAFNAFVVSLFRAGGSTVILESFQIKTLLAEVTRTQVTLLFATPSLYIAMLDFPHLSHYDLSSLKTLVYGAAPMPIEIIRQLGQMLPGCALYNAYAQSETCPAISCLEPQFALTKAGSVGKAVPFVTVAILDETGRAVPPHTVGEICCRGANIMQGYYNLPEVTASKIVDGWLHTGDLGYLDEEGFLYLADRKDDLIITVGEKVYPTEIEQILYTHTGILDCVVIGGADRVRGSVPVAFVVLKSGAKVRPVEIKRFCSKRLSDYKVPRHVQIVEMLPRNASGKVLRALLRQQWEANSEKKDEGA